MVDVSIVIRAYNEAPLLRRLLEALALQDFAGTTELIVVDNGSSDGTVEVAKEYDAKVVTLAQAEFSYPKSLNVGIERATAPVVICLVAHAYPERSDWVSRGVAHFADPRVAGVYSYPLPHRDATLWDRGFWVLPLWFKLLGVTRIKRVIPARLGQRIWLCDGHYGRRMHLTSDMGPAARIQPGPSGHLPRGMQLCATQLSRSGIRIICAVLEIMSGRCGSGIKPSGPARMMLRSLNFGRGASLLGFFENDDFAQELGVFAGGDSFCGVFGIFGGGVDHGGIFFGAQGDKWTISLWHYLMSPFLGVMALAIR